MQAALEKNHLQTLEDIEMQLVKMHGGMENVETIKLKPKMDEIEEFQTLSSGDIIDSGAVEHSSDSDYEPPGVTETFTIKSGQGELHFTSQTLNVSGFA